MPKASLIEKILFYSLVFFLPTQAAYHFWPTYAFVFGIRVDYLSPAIYSTDVLLTGILIVWFFRAKNQIIASLKKHKIFLLCFLALVAVNLFLSTFFLLTLFRWMKILVFSLFVLYISLNQNLIKSRIFVEVFSLSLILISVIGIGQFFLGRTIGGPFYFLGERTFNISTPGIALQEIFGREFLRPYSTFSHPNSLAGFIAVAILFLLNIKRQFIKDRMFRITLFLVLICFLLSASMSSYIAVLMSLFFYFLSKRKRFFWKNVFMFLLIISILSISLPVFSSKVLGQFRGAKEVVERLELSTASGRLIKENFLWGTGLDTFIPNSRLWLLQPVHNIPLLIFSEIGIAGLLAFCFLFYKALLNLKSRDNTGLAIILIFVLVTGFFDHYWLTLQQNLFLLVFVFGQIFAVKS